MPKKKKYLKGGRTNGPSHKKGGIPIEVEGGEYIIKKDSCLLYTSDAADE